MASIFRTNSKLEALEKKVASAVKKGMLHSLTLLEQINEAIEQGVLSPDEGMQLKSAELARQSVIAVDDFSNDELARHDSSH